MKWSLRLGKIAGIGIFVHWTFLLIVGWVMYLHLGSGQGLGTAMTALAFVLILFGCIVLHELGHALTARHYGIRTRDITLLPIGGVARLERLPQDPIQELWVALAGPAVNVAIAAALLVVITALNVLARGIAAAPLLVSFFAQLMWVNLLLAGFNLLPAFPMDGGRVLRALLARRIGRARATRIAAGVGQFMALLFAMAGIWLNPFLIFIGIFVFLGARVEAQMVSRETAVKGFTVHDAMLTRFRTLAASDTLERAVRELLAGSQQDFPVLDQSGRVAGMLRRNDLVRALAETERQAPVTGAMHQECPSLEPDEPLERAFETLRQGGCATLPVLDRGQLVGLVTLENVAELMMVNAALEKNESGRYTHQDFAPAHHWFLHPVRDESSGVR